jgi:hypothetical protein
MLSVIEGLMKDDKMKDMIQRFQAAGIIPTEQEIKKAQDKETYLDNFEFLHLSAVHILLLFDYKFV